MNPTQSQPITILLTPQAHQYAQQFAGEQHNPSKGKQVYLNTLAVWGVHNYLKCLNIKSDIAHSDCWQPGLRTLFNLADITLDNIGKLECLWLLPGESTTQIPLEVREDRLGYLVVQLEADLKQVDLLGFVPGNQIKFDTESVDVDQLLSLNALFDMIEQLQNQVNLGQWLTGVFSDSWQPVETILAGRMTRSLAIANPAVATITRGKAIQWQLNSLEQEIILILRMSKQVDDLVDLSLQLYPGDASDNLPTGLSISILDQADQVSMSAQTEDTDDWIQLEFSCQPGEEFKVQMDLAGISIIEQFKT